MVVLPVATPGPWGSSASLALGGGPRSDAGGWARPFNVGEVGHKLEQVRSGNRVPFCNTFLRQLGGLLGRALSCCRFIPRNGGRRGGVRPRWCRAAPVGRRPVQRCRRAVISGAPLVGSRPGTATGPSPSAPSRSSRMKRGDLGDRLALGLGLLGKAAHGGQAQRRLTLEHSVTGPRWAHPRRGRTVIGSCTPIPLDGRQQGGAFRVGLRVLGAGRCGGSKLQLARGSNSTSRAQSGQGRWAAAARCRSCDCSFLLLGCGLGYVWPDGRGPTAVTGHVWAGPLCGELGSSRVGPKALLGSCSDS